MKFIINLTYPVKRGIIFADKQVLSELEIGNFCSFPGCVFAGLFKRNDLSQASLVHESFFFAFPKILLILLCKRSHANKLFSIQMSY